jgi:hypothetical protein
MLRAVAWELLVAETFGEQDCIAELFANENATSFAGFECLTVLGTNPPKYWPALERWRRILACSGQARMRPPGHVGTGVGSPRIKDPRINGRPGG